MRYHLESSKLPFVLLTDEINFINDYIELEKLRIGNKCKIDFSFNGKFEQYVIPPLLLISLVENCFKHGIGVEKEKNEIYIRLNIENNKLEFETKNAIPENKSDYFDDKTEKTGIENIRKRLELIYNEKFDFQIINDGKLFYSSLKIEL